MHNRVYFFDTTLRDGEQSPGATMNLQEKLRLAHQLEVLGVDIMEAGFPASSPGDFEAVRAIAAQAGDIQVAGLARCVESDIDRCWEAVKSARNPRIHIFLSTSPLHMQHKLRNGPRGGAQDGRGRGQTLRRLHRQRGILCRGFLPFRA